MNDPRVNDPAGSDSEVKDLSPDEFRELGHRLVDWVADYRERLSDYPVASQVAPGWVRSQLPDLPEQPTGLPALLSEMDRIVLPGVTHWQHPSFFGYFPANASLASLLGDILSSGLGVQGMLWATSPACTELEQHVLDKLAGAVGLPPEFTFDSGGGGVIQDSASSAALVAVLVALHRASGGAWRERGVAGTDVVYVSEQTHSSLAKAARVAGLGEQRLRVIGVEPDQSLSCTELRAALAADVAAGLRPAMVCATIGTTGTGAIDPVREIAAICQEYGCWLHVDAAWAGAAGLCPELRSILDGVELADSCSVNAHKWLLTAFDASLMWTRHGSALPDALSITPEYLRNAASESGEVVDYRDWQVPLGRRFRSLKLWTVLHCVGLAGLRDHIRSHVALATELASWVRDDPGFELAADPSLSLVCVRARSDRGAEADDELSRAVVTSINSSGSAMLTHTTVAGRYVIRIAIGSQTTRREHVVDLWNQLRAARHRELTGHLTGAAERDLPARP